uniref:Uncharacterized protein n=1 Tax=Rousettus aegyptiacus TaxID=9407 RepID=A0A7J8INW7_ROUAE|nr:hypothetical protein HJG63_010732 [Rousettus aegyptiacus]
MKGALSINFSSKPSHVTPGLPVVPTHCMLHITDYIDLIQQISCTCNDHLPKLSSHSDLSPHLVLQACISQNNRSQAPIHSIHTSYLVDNPPTSDSKYQHWHQTFSLPHLLREQIPQNTTKDIQYMIICMNKGKKKRKD